MIYQNFSTRQNLAMTWWNRPGLKEYRGIVCDGSIRSGKTVSMAVGFVLWSMGTFNGQSFAICGKTIASLRRNVIRLLPQLLEGIVEIKERRSDNMLIIRAGSVTNYYFLFGGRDESSYTLVQGMTLAGVLFDEVALMPRSFVEQALARCSVEGSKIWFNCNPEGPMHWFYLEWIKQAKKRKILHLHFTMEDNPSLSAAKKAEYENTYSGVFYDRYVRGLWARSEGLIYPMFDKKKHIAYTMPAISLRHRYYVSIDYGTVNPFAAGLYDYDPVEHKVLMVKELYYEGGSADRVDNEKYYEMLCQLIGPYTIEYIVIDPSASSMIETILKYGKYMVVQADNDVINGIQDVTKYLNLGVLAFHASCTKTFEEFEEYSWNEKAKEDAVIKEKDHSMDQLRYFCRTVLRNELAGII